MARYDTILDTIGNTPLVRLQKLAPKQDGCISNSDMTLHSSNIHYPIY